MAVNYETLPGEIVRLVGGKQNIKGLTHCMTRLRFDLADYAKAKTEVLSKTEGILKVINSGSQYQVVIGNKVESVYESIIKQTGINGG